MVEGDVAEVVVADGAISCHTSISDTSPLVVRSLARPDSSGGARQDRAQALPMPLPGGRGNRMIVESLSQSQQASDGTESERGDG